MKGFDIITHNRLIHFSDIVVVAVVSACGMGNTMNGNGSKGGDGGSGKLSSMDGGSGGKGGMMGGSPSGMRSVDGGSSGKGYVVLDTTGTAFYGSFVTTGRSTFLPNSIIHMSVFA